MTNLTRILTPPERPSHRASSFVAQSLCSGPLVIERTSVSKFNRDNDGQARLRGLGIQNKLCPFRHLCGTVEPPSGIRSGRGPVESSQNRSRVHRTRRNAALCIRVAEFANSVECTGIYKRLCLHDDVIDCPDDRERISGVAPSLSLAAARVAYHRADTTGNSGRKYTTFAAWVCRGHQEFSVKRAEDSGGDDNPVQGCTERVMLKAEQCRRRHFFFHIPDRAHPTFWRRFLTRVATDVTNGSLSNKLPRFACDRNAVEAGKSGLSNAIRPEDIVYGDRLDMRTCIFIGLLSRFQASVRLQPASRLPRPVPEREQDSSRFGGQRRLESGKLPGSADPDRFRLRVIRQPAQRVAYVRVVGECVADKILGGFDRLMEWGDRHRLAPTGQLIGMSLDR
jgi:hypothetical protein